MEGMNHKRSENGLDFLFGDDHIGGGHNDDLSLDETNLISNAWDAIESGIFGDIGGILNLGVCIDEEDLDSPLQLDSASYSTEVSNFPIVGKGRMSIGASVASEFDTPAKQVAYILVHEHIVNCFQSAVGKQARSESLDWIFCEGKDEFHRTFAECCEILMVRPWILQTRLQFQFFSKGQAFSKPISKDVLRIPSLLESESVHYAGYEGAILCTIAWGQPGIPHVDLVGSSLSSLKAVHQLEERGILSEVRGGWYATGRNPIAKAYIKRTVSWTDLWPSES